MSEKEFLRRLGERLHGGSLEWRDDGIMAPVGTDECLVYSLDRPTQIYNTGHRATDLRLFGRWSASVVANDVIACGVRPRGIAFDVGIEELNQHDLMLWADGVLDVCERYSMKYEGGNLATGFGVTGMAWGTVVADRTLRRNGARDGDIIVVTCELGLGWVLRLWEQLIAPEFENEIEPFRSYKNEPWVNLRAFEEIWKLRAINAAMDLTDGVIEFGYEIWEQSHLGVILEPIARHQTPFTCVADKLQIPSEAFFFEPGYDTPFGHGWAVPHKALPAVRAILESFAVPYVIAGSVSSKSAGVLARINDRLVAVPRYWDDVFRPRGEIERWRTEIVSLFQ